VLRAMQLMCLLALRFPPSKWLALVRTSRLGAHLFAQLRASAWCKFIVLIANGARGNLWFCSL
jgi:hypothetical protein